MAIFAIFGGYYYWVGKISGFQFPEKWGLVHFWVFTIAINLVFFPMHFVGLAGQPRRISDYPDGYEGWNHIISIGSFLTAISLMIFLYTLSFRIFNPASSTIDVALRARWSAVN